MRARTWLGLLCQAGAAVVSGFAAGGQLFALVAVVPYVRELPPPASAELHSQVLTGRPDRYLRPASIAAAALGVGGLLTGRGKLSTVATAAAIAQILGVGLVSVTTEFPINRRILEQPAQTAPADYEELRRRWDRGHRVRALLGLGAHLCFVLALLKTPNPDGRVTAGPRAG